jgi:hypothetical protein
MKTITLSANDIFFEIQINNVTIELIPYILRYYNKKFAAIVGEIKIKE